MASGKDLGMQMLDAVKVYVGRSMQSFADRIDALESRALVAGPPGADGKDGTSVSLEDLLPIVQEAIGDLNVFKAGLVQRVESVIDSIPAPVAGPPGDPGKDGESVEAEQVQRMVDDMVAAAMASIPRPQNGIDGAKGEAGRDGKDAPQLEILSGVDPERRYARNTYARHAGGLIRAFRDTDAINLAEVEKSGWEVVLNGIADESEEISEDGRTIIKTTRYTSGPPWVRSYQTGSIQYQGIYLAEKEYFKGDIVTWGGESWYCTEDKTMIEPKYNHGGTSPWKLIAKKGRDGKDGKGK